MTESLSKNELINPSDCWIPLKLVAGLKGVTDRAVRISIRADKYMARTIRGKGGKTYEILLASIEPDLQKKYINDYYKDLVLSEVGSEIEKIEPKRERIIPENLKRIALARLDLLNFWEKFKKERKKKGQANKEFLNLYNTGEYHKHLYEVLGKVSIGTLYRWQSCMYGYTSNDWTRLVPEYRFNKEGELRTSLTDEEIKIFMKILLNQNKFSIGKAIGLTKHILEKRGFEILPKDVTFRRYANWFKTHHYDKWIFAREGQKALKDKVEPYIIRDASVLEVGQILVSDGHKLNFQVLNPFTGKPCRATLVGFLDWKSGALVGYEIMLEENTQCIASALRNSIINLGRIPEIVYQDNGKAFKSKFFNGDKDFEELGFTGVYGKLGIKAVYASPYNARAKVIERFFKEFQEGFEKLLPSYIGSSIEEKPAYLKRNEKLHKEIHSGYVPTIQEAIRLIDVWLEYRNSLPCPNAEGKSIAEVLAEVKKEEINIDELDDLMMAQEIKTINRNGIRFLKADYFDDTLYGIRTKVIIKYSLFDLSFIKVYSLKGQYLCRAYRIEPTHPMATHLGTIKDVEDYKQKIVKQKQLRNKTLKAVQKYFNIQDVKALKENLSLISEVEQVELSEEKPQIPVVKVRVQQPLTRPVFASKYERYEWHMKNGCHSQENRKWVEIYKRSDEYRMIYEKGV